MSVCVLQEEFERQPLSPVSRCGGISGPRLILACGSGSALLGSRGEEEPRPGDAGGRPCELPHHAGGASTRLT